MPTLLCSLHTTTRSPSHPVVSELQKRKERSISPLFLAATNTTHRIYTNFKDAPTRSGSLAAMSSNIWADLKARAAKNREERLAREMKMLDAMEAILISIEGNLEAIEMKIAARCADRERIFSQGSPTAATPDNEDNQDDQENQENQESEDSQDKEDNQDVDSKSDAIAGEELSQVLETPEVDSFPDSDKEERPAANFAEVQLQGIPYHVASDASASTDSSTHLSNQSDAEFSQSETTDKPEAPNDDEILQPAPFSPAAQPGYSNAAQFKAFQEENHGLGLDENDRWKRVVLIQTQHDRLCITNIPGTWVYRNTNPRKGVYDRLVIKWVQSQQFWWCADYCVAIAFNEPLVRDQQAKPMFIMGGSPEQIVPQPNIWSAQLHGEGTRAAGPFWKEAWEGCREIANKRGEVLVEDTFEADKESAMEEFLQLLNLHGLDAVIQNFRRHIDRLQVLLGQEEYQKLLQNFRQQEATRQCKQRLINCAETMSYSMILSTEKGSIQKLISCIGVDETQVFLGELRAINDEQLGRAKQAIIEAVQGGTDVDSEDLWNSEAGRALDGLMDKTEYFTFLIELHSMERCKMPIMTDQFGTNNQFRDNEDDKGSVTSEDIRVFEFLDKKIDEDEARQSPYGPGGGEAGPSQDGYGGGEAEPSQYGYGGGETEPSQYGHGEYEAGPYSHHYPSFSFGGGPAVPPDGFGPQNSAPAWPPGAAPERPANTPAQPQAFDFAPTDFSEKSDFNFDFRSGGAK